MAWIGGFGSASNAPYKTDIPAECTGEYPQVTFAQGYTSGEPDLALIEEAVGSSDEVKPVYKYCPISEDGINFSKMTQDEILKLNGL